MSAPNPYEAAISAPETESRWHRLGSSRRTRANGETGGHFSLRWGVVVIVAFISLAGLAVNVYAVGRTTSELVYSRIDEDLEHGLNGWANQDSLFNDNSSGTTRPPTEFYVYRVLDDGTTLEFRESTTTPDFRNLRLDGSAQNIPSQGSSSTIWRAMAVTEDGVTTIVAKDVSQEASILTRLTFYQVLIALTLLFGMGLLAYWWVGRTLRPLREVEETANAIAHGDLSRRVPERRTSSEIASLSGSLNIMLERLQALIEELQEKEEQMRRFVGDASHELRTPLTSVKGFAELYRSGATQDSSMVIDRIEAEAARMSLLVEDLLALTRAEGAQFEQSPVDLLEVASSVTMSLRAAYPERNIRVQANCSQIPMVIGDASRLHQVLTNLTVNGLKHGGPDADVEISITYSDKSVIVEVSDNGVGISEQDAAHIFERFYRADSSRTRATGGSGLGLAITKSLVESHGGTIGVASQVGVGTTFRIEFPLHQP
ncbi:MAG: HAMP domain-containing sensor histidine kinase [Corynebacterium sp.]|nr:HAMP domain-containing sensor histidine kinase [Corynebacterium sp.]